MEITLKQNSTRVFAANYNSTAKIVVNRGGTRSSKSYSLCQLGVHWLFTGQIGRDQFIEKGVWSEVRKTLPSLKASAYRDYIDILTNTGTYQHVKENKTERTISFGPRMIEFFSVDDQQKVRSRKRDILHINEANEIDFKNTFYQLLMRTKHKVFLDFNPDDPDIWINTEIEQKRAVKKGDVDVIVSNYKWNPFLTSEEIEEIEYMAQVDPELWEVFGRGGYGKLTGLIFPKYTLIDSFPEDVKLKGYGLDFGYKHPQALVRVGIDTEGKNLYLDEIYYERNRLNSEMINEMSGLGVGPNDIIYADSAAPGKIQEVFNAGFRGIKPANKAKDSVEAGLLQMKGFKLHITARSTNILKEQRKYKWEVDKNGETIQGQPIKLNDDAFDAARYFVFTTLYKPKGTQTPRASARPRKTKPLR